MKLQDFLIGVLAFILFVSICLSVAFNMYGSRNLNLTMDYETNKSVYMFANEVGVPDMGIRGNSSEGMYDSTDEVRKKSIGGESSDTGSATSSEGEQQLSAIKALSAVPASYTVVTRLFAKASSMIGIDARFMAFFLASIVIIISIIFLGSVLKNRLES